MENLQVFYVPREAVGLITRLKQMELITHLYLLGGLDSPSVRHTRAVLSVRSYIL